MIIPKNLQISGIDHPVILSRQMILKFLDRSKRGEQASVVGVRKVAWYPSAQYSTAPGPHLTHSGRYLPYLRLFGNYIVFQYKKLFWISCLTLARVALGSTPTFPDISLANKGPRETGELRNTCVLFHPHPNPPPSRGMGIGEAGRGYSRETCLGRVS
jgi:hypothetical protein